MGDYYFDDEELINDAMEEDFEPPDMGEFDEAFMESELMATQDKKTKNDDVQMEPAEEDEQEPPDDAEETAVPSTVQVTLDTEPKTDVYSFERYQGDWRTKKESPTTAKSWKQHGFQKASLLDEQLMDTSSSRRPPSAADAQLVEFWNRRQVRNPKCKLVESPSVSLRPTEGNESMSMTLGDGTCVHVRKSPTREQETSSNKGSILGVSMAELLRRSDNILRKAERQKIQESKRTFQEESKRALQSEESMMEQEEEETESMVKEKKLAETPNTKDDPDSQLWVDKHAPSAFSHLLSDDRTNREVLRALRAWDPYVFRKEPPPRPTFLQQREKELAAKRGEEDKDTSMDKKKSNDVRPDESNRVILLSGPPGVGKSTLAHVIARHAGYRPMEVNASDERSASVLKERVIRAMESSTLNLPSKNGEIDEMVGRPNCIILDEIDGADAKGAIAALVEIIRAEIPLKTSKNKKPFLRRPIIFICNHKYAPALRPVLPYAKQFDVAPPNPSRLVARLRSVLSLENLSVFGGSSLLNQLVAGTGGDVRSCLYALQFAAARAREIANKKQDELTGKAPLVDVSSSLKAALGGNGMKDERNDVSATVTAVFRKTKQKKFGGTSGKNHGQPIERVLQLVQSFGDNSKTLDCLFTNLLQVSYVDPTLDRCTLAHEWLSSGDIYRSHKTAVASNNHMEHHGMQELHMPTAAAAIHLLCRVETRTDLVFSSRQMIDARYGLEANDNLAHKFVEGLAPSARRGANAASAAIETIPYAMWMLSAGVGSFSLNRAVSTLEILNKNELRAFNEHVATLRALGLTYVANEEFSHKHDRPRAVTMRLEPQIDRLVKFQELSAPLARKKIPSVLKELLAHRATIEGIRGNANGTAKPSPSSKSSMLGLKKKLGASAKDKTQEDTTSPAIGTSPSTKKKLDTAVAPSAKRSKTLKAPANFLGLGAAKAKAARTARKAALVGFDKSKRLKVSNTGSGIPFNHVMRFKYQKGFTQAVRTPCKMEDIA